MPVHIKRVAYTYNEALELAGEPAYFFDCYVSRDREILIDRHESFKQREEFMSAIGEIVPLLEEADEDRSGGIS